MNSALVVSTECPTCGAPLDFSEGSNAVRCLHCGSHLLVTGRKQTLSYAILPRIDDQEALKRVRLVQGDGHTPPRVVKAQLYFVPYYRLTGHDFFWEKTDPPLKAESFAGLSDRGEAGALPGIEIGAASTGIIRAVIDLFHSFRGVPEEKEPSLYPLSSGPVGASQKGTIPIKAVISGKRGAGEGEVSFRDRYVEKNFIACHLEGLGLYSLGVRPAVLRLTLFQREALAKQGKIVGVALAPDDALVHGMKGADSEKIVYRQVIGRVLSLIYFPFWVIEMEQRGEGGLQVVDAVSERVIQLDAPLSTYEQLDRPSAGQGDVVGFRPLTCPNCGWDFPAKPEEVIFVCASCDKVWQIRGRSLDETAYAIAAVAGLEGSAAYLPFWVLEIERESDRSDRCFIPAFRYRRLKMLSDLARRISEKQPDYSMTTGAKPELHGCYYDQEDAASMAQFIHAGADRKSLEKAGLGKNRFQVKNATLTWFPFSDKAGGLIDPFTGLSLPKNLLI
ncbi:MAG TPA: hypothetical protein VFA47_13775 [Candidatus Manganitrophaceae bacterium]|nr:hypothetical protein [Candidatus Manganitrophaceae bacterium]